MPIYEYVCQYGHYHDVICGVSDLKPTSKCPECGKTAKRAWRPSGGYVSNMDDTTWSKVTAEVLDPRDSNPIMVEARQNPTKRNVLKAMKYKGLRFEEKGEKEHRETTDQFIDRTQNFVADELRKHRRIEI